MMLTLAEEKRRLIDGKEKTTEKFIKRFMKAIDNKEWLLIPCVSDNQGTRFIIEDHYGKKYIAVYSGEKSFKVAKDMISTDINKVVDTLFGDANLSGVVLDLNDQPIYIERKQIDWFSSRKDPRLAQRNWGKGIPKYNETDLKTKEELHDFAMEVIDGFLEQEGYVIQQRYNFSSYFVNYIVSKGRNLFYICVEAGVAPNIPDLQENKKERLIIAARNQNAIPLFASVSFGAADSVRFNKGLALCGDQFYTRFNGFEEI